MEMRDDYPEEFGRAELVGTAKFYRDHSPPQVLQEREQSRILKKMGFAGAASSRNQPPHVADMQAELSKLVARYGFRIDKLALPHKSKWALILRLYLGQGRQV
ncbi:hypothetical protein BDW75DRAFT_241079 [Aspergillus navahoensis]